MNNVKQVKTNHERNLAFKRELRRSNIEVDLILHPSRIPDTKEVNEILSNGIELGAAAVENDVRRTLTAISVQNGKLTDKFTAWEKIHTMEDIKLIIPEKILTRVYGSKIKTLNDIKSSLTVMDLTFEELKYFSSHGNQELLSFSDYLQIYAPMASLLSGVPKLAIDLKDLFLSKKVLEVVEEQKLDQNIYVLMERSLDSFNMTKKFLESKGKDIPICLLPQTELLITDGVEAFKTHLRSSIINDGVNIFSINISEFKIVNSVVLEFNDKGVSMIVYIPSEKFDIKKTIEMLSKNKKAIKAIQLDN